MCAIEGKTDAVVVASYRSVPRNPFCFKALIKALISKTELLEQPTVQLCILHCQGILALVLKFL